MKISLAEALLRRKELQEKVEHLKPINQEKLFEVRVNRQQVTEGIDNVVAQVPKVAITQVTHAFDWHAKALRKIDATIQRANWETQIDIDESVMADYVDPYVKID